MSLRQQANADLIGIVGSVSDFGWPITVTSPAGVELAMVGLSTDIGTTLDPETSLPVSGRRASVALAIATLTAGGMTLPEGVYDKNSKPWLVTFADISGTVMTFKVIQTHPDRAIGLITCIVERYLRAG